MRTLHHFGHVSVAGASPVIPGAGNYFVTDHRRAWDDGRHVGTFATAREAIACAEAYVASQQPGPS
jgi:hypothetical protein